MCIEILDFLLPYIASRASTYTSRLVQLLNAGYDRIAFTALKRNSHMLFSHAYLYMGG